MGHGQHWRTCKSKQSATWLCQCGFCLFFPILFYIFNIRVVCKLAHVYTYVCTRLELGACKSWTYNWHSRAPFASVYLKFIFLALRAYLVFLISDVCCLWNVRSNKCIFVTFTHYMTRLKICLSFRHQSCAGVVLAACCEIYVRMNYMGW